MTPRERALRWGSRAAVGTWAVAFFVLQPDPGPSVTLEEAAESVARVRPVPEEAVELSLNPDALEGLERYLREEEMP